MKINKTNYTFTSTTKSINTKFKKTINYNKPQYINTYPHFKKTIINTKKNKLIINPTI